MNHDRLHQFRHKMLYIGEARICFEIALCDHLENHHIPHKAQICVLLYLVSDILIHSLRYVKIHTRLSVYAYRRSLPQKTSNDGN